MRVIGLWVLALGVVAVYPLVAFYPYAFDGPSIHANDARYVDGAARFPRHGILVSPASPKWLRGVVAGDGFAVTLEIVPSAIDLRGPARILTVSRGGSTRNLTIGQTDDALIVRLRTPHATANGMPELVLPGVFQVGKPLHIAIEATGDADAMALRVALDGLVRVQRQLGARAFAGWDTTMRLALGNEIDAPRPWRGMIRTARIQAGGMAYDYLEPRALERPGYVWYARQINLWFLFVSGSAAEAAMNLFGFIPLGMVMAALLFGRLGRAMALVAGTSLVIEVIQYLTPTRLPSLADLLLNVAGGAIGIALFIMLRRRWPGLWRTPPARPI